MRVNSPEKQKEIFKIQMAIILTCLVVAISLIEAHSYVPNRPLNDVKINNFVNSDDTSISKNIQKPQKTETESTLKPDTGESESTLTVKERITKIAKEENFKWPSYIKRLIYCESRFNINATNSNGKYGVDRGPVQINSYYHPEVSDECAYNLECSVKWAMKQINAGNQSLWVCDQYVRGNPDYIEKH